MKIPGAANVTRSLAALKKSLKGCLRQVNQQAGKLLAKGNYAGAESLVEVAKSVDSFRAEVESLHERWKEVKGSRGGEGKQQTPLWEYYQPVVRALQSLGGEAKLADLLVAVERQMNGRFKPGDLQLLARGKPRWQAMVRRARKHMVQEGFLEAATGSVWRLLPPGRRTVANRPQDKTE